MAVLTASVVVGLFYLEQKGMHDEALLSPDTELDFTSDSAVEVKEGIWTITSAELEEVESDKGKGTRVVIEFASDVIPFPIAIRQFIKYDYKNGGDNSWVKRSRGVLKQLTKAATGGTTTSLNGLVGKQVRARTKDDGDGFYTLTAFRTV